jgi:hypothetical protein
MRAQAVSGPLVWLTAGMESGIMSGSNPSRYPPTIGVF